MSVMNPKTARTASTTPKARPNDVSTAVSLAAELMQLVMDRCQYVFDGRSKDDTLNFIQDVFERNEFFYSAEYDQFDIKSMFMYIHDLHEHGVFEDTIYWAAEQFKTDISELVPFRLVEFFFPRDAQKITRWNARAKKQVTFHNPERSGLLLWLKGVCVEDKSIGGLRHLRFIQEDGTRSEINLATRVYLTAPVGEDEPETLDQDDITMRVRKFDPEAAAEIKRKLFGDDEPSQNFGVADKPKPDIIDSDSLHNEIMDIICPDIDDIGDTDLHKFISDLCSNPCRTHEKLEQLLFNKMRRKQVRPETADQALSKFHIARHTMLEWLAGGDHTDDSENQSENEEAYAIYRDLLS